MKEPPIVIAIDGTSASGKSTAARMAAQNAPLCLRRYRRDVSHPGLALRQEQD